RQDPVHDAVVLGSSICRPTAGPGVVPAGASVLATRAARQEWLMSIQDNGTTVTGGDAAAGQQLIVNAQYIKDFSFENPRAPHSLLQQKDPPEVQLGVDVKAQGLAQDVFEVMLTVSANAAIAGETVFDAEPALPLCAQHRRQCHTGGRIPAAAHPPRRFRRDPAPPADHAARRADRDGLRRPESVLSRQPSATGN